MYEGRMMEEDSSSEPVMQEHKVKLYKNFKDQNLEAMVEVLLSLRVNAL
jgi:hypothetical protein